MTKRNNFKPLKIFMRGKSVAALQTQLRHRGFAIDDPASVFGPSTRDAVKAMQNQFALKPTGMVDSAMWEMLGGIQPSAAITQPSVPTTPSPASEPAVKKLDALVRLLISKGMIEQSELDSLIKEIEKKPETPLFL